MLKRKGSIKFTVGYVNDELFIGTPEELSFGSNVPLGTITLKTFVNPANGETVYGYHNCIGTLKEIAASVKSL